MEQYQVVLTVDKVVENMPLSDDQFQIKLPEGTKNKNVDSGTVAVAGRMR
jgi:hypothetical protein